MSKPVAIALAFAKSKRHTYSSAHVASVHAGERVLLQQSKSQPGSESIAGPEPDSSCNPYAYAGSPGCDSTSHSATDLNVCG